MQKTTSRVSTALTMVAVASLLLAACGSDEEAGAAAQPEVVAAATARVALVQESLDEWASADALEVAQAAAERVSNLITGPGVSVYGDADGDGVVGGEVTQGLLPGASGESSLGLPLQGCAGADLLGGSWTDPGRRWEELTTRVAAWTPTNNPFPELPSHAQRTVGWAQLTLRSTDLTEAREFSGHAQLHVDATAAAVAECS